MTRWMKSGGRNARRNGRRTQGVRLYEGSRICEDDDDDEDLSVLWISGCFRFSTAATVALTVQKRKRSKPCILVAFVHCLAHVARVPLWMHV